MGIIDTEIRSLTDDEGAFSVTNVMPATPRGLILFAVGRGGDPARHRPLLQAFAADGLAVVSPHFERLATPMPTAEELSLRARRLRMALDTLHRRDLPVAGVGHSIGATMLLALAGGQLWLDRNGPLAIDGDPRLQRLALMAPATGFFMAPGALAEVRTPLLVYAGSEDSITPPSQAMFLRESLAGQVPVEVRLIEGAGHFSFMDELPPQVADGMPARADFLSRLARELSEFAGGG